MKARKIIGLTALLLVVFLLSSCLFFLCYQFDNKYRANEPQAVGGVLMLNEWDLQQYPVIYLTHDWEIYRGKLLEPKDFKTEILFPDELIFIGQYGGFEGHIDKDKVSRSPHGSATYRLNISLPLETRSYTLELPEIYSAYKLYINGRLFEQMGDPSLENYRPETGNSFVTVQAAERMEILIAVSDYSHFYSGMVYPPAFGEPNAVVKLLNTRFSIRVAAVAIALCIGLLYLCVWLLTKKEIKHSPASQNTLLYAALCGCFVLYICYPVIKTLFHGGMRFYAVENFAYCAMFLLVMLISERITGMKNKFTMMFVSFAVFICCLALLVPHFLGDNFRFIMTYSALINIYAWVCMFFLIISAAYGVYKDAIHSKVILTGTTVFGAALLMDRLFPMFEPIRFGWFAELAGGILVALIGFVMAMEIARQFRMRLALEGRVENVSRMMEMQSAYYPIILEKEEEAKAAQHDLRHHIAVIREMVKNGDFSKLMDYLNAYDDKQTKPVGTSYCKHYVADMLLRMYAELALQQNTPISIEVHLPETIVVNDVDLCVVLSNLLENALEASARIPEDMRYIKIHIRYELCRLGIFVTNHFDGFLKVKNGRYLSSKQTEREGIGLLSVWSICESNGGSADFYADEKNVFHSEVTLLAREEGS